MITPLPVLLQYASAASAFVSAGLWVWSAKVQIPRATFRLWLGDCVAPSTPRDDAMAKQAWISAAAALMAGLAAFLQGLSTWLTPLTTA